MDQETIQKIASEIVRHLPPSWAFLAVQTLVMLIAAALGVFVGEHLRSGRRALATKAEFAAIQAQLRAVTEAVETIEAEIGHTDWAKREWTNLRQHKLEELLTRMDECRTYLDRQRVKALGGRTTDEPNPESSFDSIGTLYFPELRAEIQIFSDAFNDLHLRALILAGEVMQAQAAKNPAAENDARDKYLTTELPSRQTALQDAASKLKSAARNLLATPVNVEHGSESEPPKSPNS